MTNKKIEQGPNIKSHIVPVTYLKHFTDGTNKLWQFKIKAKYPAKIKSAYPSEVCYQENFYRIKNEWAMRALKVSDKDYVEKVAFKDYEDNYNEVLENIFSQKQFILTKDAEFILSVIINIKGRNQAHRAYFNKKDLEEILSRNVPQSKDEARNMFPYATEAEIDELVIRTNENILNSEDIEKDSFMWLLIDKDKKGTRIITKVKNIVLNCLWYFLVTDLSSPFITSDNPGFCSDEKDSISNTNFSGNFVFYFPLTPIICFMATNKFRDLETNPLTKRIIYTPANSLRVDMINKGIIETCNESIFSNEKNTLEKYQRNNK